MTTPETRAPLPNSEKRPLEPGGLPDMGAETMRERQATLRWVFVLGTLGSVLVAAINLAFFSYSGAWQFVAVAGAMALALGLFLVSSIVARRGRIDTAGTWALLGVVLAVVLTELFHQGVSVYLVPGGALLILVTGYLVLPRRLPVVTLLAAAFVGYAWFVNHLEASLPFQRYDMAQLGDRVDIFAVFIVGFLLLGGGWGVVRTYRRIVAIRTRLAVSFVLVVLLTAAIVLAAAVALVYRHGRDQVIAQLGSIATIKEAEIQRWAQGVQSDLDLVLHDSQLTPRVLVLLESPGSAQAQEYFALAYLEQMVARSERLESLLLLDGRGRVILSTQPGEKGQSHSAERYFQGGLEDFYLQPPTVSREAGPQAGTTGPGPDTGQMLIVAARPIVDLEGQTVGVLAGKVRAASLTAILGRQAWIGDTGEVYLVVGDGVLLTDLRFAPRPPAGEPAPGEHFVLDTEAARLAVTRREGGSLLYTDYRGETALGVYRWLPALQAGLVAKQDRQEAFGIGYLLILVVGLAGLIAIVLAVGVSLVVTRTITEPLAHLTAHAHAVASGDLGLALEAAGSLGWSSRRDEVGTLARAFDSMSRQVRDLVETLEARVTERTRELERRTAYLEASAEVGRAASSILDPDELVREVVGLIGQQFGLDATELYLLDGRGEWAVLQAASGPGGRALPGRDQRVRVEAGTVDLHEILAAHRTARPPAVGGAPDGEQRAVEAVLPLRSRGQALGAILVRAGHGQPLDEDTLVVLQAMAGQVAIALDNARLFVAAQRAAEAERRAHGEVDRQAWAGMVRARAVCGYRCDAAGVLPLQALPFPMPDRGNGAALAGQAQQARVEDDRGGRTASVPLMLRKEPIGLLRFHKAGSGAHWSEDELALLLRLSEELGQALESARLYQDVQRGAARDRLIAGVTGQMRQSLQVDAVLRSAIQEMRRALLLSEVEVRLGQASRPADGDGGGSTQG